MVSLQASLPLLFLVLFILCSYLNFQPLKHLSRSRAVHKHTARSPTWYAIILASFLSELNFSIRLMKSFNPFGFSNGFDLNKELVIN